MKPVPLFYTPRDLEEMQAILDKLPPSERATVYPYVMMMYNLLTSKTNGTKTTKR